MSDYAAIVLRHNSLWNALPSNIFFSEKHVSSLKVKNTIPYKELPFHSYTAFQIMFDKHNVLTLEK